MSRQPTNANGQLRQDARPQTEGRIYKSRRSLVRVARRVAPSNLCSQVSLATVHWCLSWPLSTGVCFGPLTTGVCLCAAVRRCLFLATDVPQCIWPLFTGVRLWPLFTGVCFWPLTTVSLATVHGCLSLCHCPQVSVFVPPSTGVCFWPLTTVSLAIVHRCLFLATVHRCLSLAAVHNVSVFGHCPQVTVFVERGFLRD